MSDELLDDRIYFEVNPMPEELEEFTLRVSDLHGMERISRLYDFDITIACDKPDGITPEAIDELLHADVLLRFGPGATRNLFGVLSHIELVSMGRAQDGDDSIYRAEVVPHFWRTRLTRRSRCFVGKSIPEIFGIVLDESGIDHELRLTQEYRSNVDSSSDPASTGPEVHVVQYEESDYDFLCRWMERLGMYFLFEQTDSGELLIITDANSELTDATDFPEVVYSRTAGTTEAGRLTSLRQVTRARPRDVHVRDFNWRAQAQTRLVLGDAPVNPGESQDDPPEERTGHGFQIYYADHHLTDEEGARMAQVRAEEWMARKSTFTAASRNHDWSAGKTFSLVRPPPPNQNEDEVFPELYRKYLLVGVVHHASWGQGGGSYSNTVEMLDYEYEFRTARHTPWPRIEGVINARIDDDPDNISSAAPIDERGYYRVIMPYDYYAEVGQRPSTWVRKAEPYAGLRHGMHFSLHSGCEVLLAHIDGDPDRPIIVGAMPNEWNMSPVTSQEPTRNVIRTRSGIVIDFEDDAS